MFLKLGTTNVQPKRNKMTPLVLLPWQQFCRWCCVNKNCNSRFCFKTRTIYPTQSNDGTKDNMGTISVPSRTLCPTLEIANGDFFAFWQKETGAKRVAMQTAVRVSFCLFLMYIYGAKFQEHCFNISRDIVYSVFSTFKLQTVWRHHWSNLHNAKTSISLNEKRSFEKKNTILYFERAFK